LDNLVTVEHQICSHIVNEATTWFSTIHHTRQTPFQAGSSRIQKTFMLSLMAGIPTGETTGIIVASFV
jgi:hypothetical protein